MKIEVNGHHYTVPKEWQDASLLTVLRDYLSLTGTKFGCGKGYCGACTVHYNDTAARACLLPLDAIGEASITTIEGLSDGETLHPVQQAWIAESVPQCGYCQPGQIMQAAAFLSTNTEPSDDSIKQAMAGNLCRCGTYVRIRRAVARAAQINQEQAKP